MFFVKELIELHKGLYELHTQERGLFMEVPWNASQVCLAEGICRGLKACWKGGSGEDCPTNLPEVGLTH